MQSLRKGDHAKFHRLFNFLYCAQARADQTISEQNLDMDRASAEAQEVIVKLTAQLKGVS